ncbi:MAG: MgtC/SapB family protein [Veillonellaceae bacterium]|nr:MgtC/SapB family protein [Veillonellaceae bacterium]
MERQQRHKSAGLRTHILVSLGSCLIMLISYKLYASVQGLTNADPARLAAQVVSGIGFLGAGTIMKEGLTIKGLTTAASLWVVAGVGLAVGAGYYVGAVATTVLSVLALTYLPRFERLYGCGPSQVALAVRSVDKPGQIGRIGSYLGTKNVAICDIKIDEISKNDIYVSVIVDVTDRRIIPDIVEGLKGIDGVVDVQQE